MNGFRSSFSIILVLIIALFCFNFFLCLSLNEEEEEGIALLKFKDRVVKDPFGALSSWKEKDGEIKTCSWFGIECADGHVVCLNLRNFGLEGTLAPELGHLLHIKSIILRNNSFSGVIPEEIRGLEELELLDLSNNNFSGSLPEFGYNIPIFLLDNNGLPFDIYPEVEEHIMLSEARMNDNQLTSAMDSLPFTRHNGGRKDQVLQRKLAEKNSKETSQFLHGSSDQDDQNVGSTTNPLPTSPTFQRGDEPQRVTDTKQVPTPKTNQSPLSPLAPPQPPPPLVATPSPTLPTSIAVSPPQATPPPKSQKKLKLAAVLGAVGGFIVFGLVMGIIYLWKSQKITKVTGLSGTLQKGFITGNDRSDGSKYTKPSFIEGISNLKRSELETACEDFSNVIGSSSIGTIYKGTLSRGVEIAVLSLAVTSAKEWSRHLETQFRKKIETVSKVDHKNFIKLIGYCEEEYPFTRMMIFEYAPNGTLFEHLHVREAEHLDWGIRLRVTMGMAYCLEHMHQLVPPVTHPNFNSAAVSLSEDYAARISDFCLWNQVAAVQVQSTTTKDNLSPSSTTPDNNVYSFALVLVELMTGRVPLSVGNNSLEDWVLDYLREEQSLREWVDPMLRYFNPEQLEKISEVIRKCLQLDPHQRPTMRDVAARLGKITGIDRDKAAPRLSPLWWDEVEVLYVA